MSLMGNIMRNTASVIAATSTTGGARPDLAWRRLVRTVRPEDLTEMTSLHRRFIAYAGADHGFDPQTGMSTQSCINRTIDLTLWYAVEGQDPFDSSADLDDEIDTMLIGLRQPAGMYSGTDGALIRREVRGGIDKGTNSNGTMMVASFTLEIKYRKEH